LQKKIQNIKSNNNNNNNNNNNIHSSSLLYVYKIREETIIVEGKD
jgi:hypothetical protein